MPLLISFSMHLVLSCLGSLLKRLHNASQSSTGKSTLTVDHQTLQDSSDISFRLDITQETDKTVDDLQNSIQESSTCSVNKSTNSPGAAADSEALQFHAKENKSPGLLIYESDDDASDSNGSDKFGGHRSTDVPDTMECGASSKKPPYSETTPNRELSQKGPSTLMIKESDDEDTDLSDNECDKLPVGKSGLFTPDMLQRSYGTKPDILSETDKSDAEGLFSPGVVGITKSGTTNSISKIDEDNSDSQDYMLVATQAYGIDDSGDNDTDFEGSPGFECNSNKRDLKSEKPMDFENNSQIFSSVTSNEKEVTRRSVVGTNKREEATQIVSKGDRASYNKDLSGIILSDQEADTLKLSETSLEGFASEQESKTIPIIGQFQEEDDLNENMHDNILKRDSSCGNDDLRDDHMGNDNVRAGKIWKEDELERNYQEGATIPLYDLGQEAKTLTLQQSSDDGCAKEKGESEPVDLCRMEQEGKTIALQDYIVDTVEKSEEDDSVNRMEQEGKTIALGDYNVDVDTVEKSEEDDLVNRMEQEGKTIALQDYIVDTVEKSEEDDSVNRMEQEGKTIALGDYNVDVDTVEKSEEDDLVNRMEQEGKTIALQDYIVDTVEKSEEDDSVNRMEQEGKTIALGDYNVDVDTLENSEEDDLVNRMEQEGKTIALGDYNIDVDTEETNKEEAVPLNRIEQEGKTVALYDYEDNSDAEETIEENSVNRTEQECKTIALQEACGIEEAMGKRSDFLEGNSGLDGLEPSLNNSREFEMEKREFSKGKLQATMSKCDENSSLNKITQNASASDAKEVRYYIFLQNWLLLLCTVNFCRFCAYNNYLWYGFGFVWYLLYFDGGPYRSIYNWGAALPKYF